MDLENGLSKASSDLGRPFPSTLHTTVGACLRCYCKLVFLVLLLSYLVLCSQTGKIYYHNVPASESVQLPCSGSSNMGSEWRYEDTVLFRNKVPMQEKFGKTVTLFENYTLFIKSVEIQHEGLYSCFRDSVSQAKHVVDVEVTPELHVSIGGMWESEVFLEVDKNVLVECKAIGARPGVNLTLLANNMTTINATIRHRMFSNSETNVTFDTILTVMIKPGDNDGTVTCFSEGQSTSSSKQVHMNYSVYVAPTVYLQINGEGITDIFKIKKHKEIVATCHAVGAKPSANISWSINDEMIDSSYEISNVINVSSQNNETFDTVSTLLIRPDLTTGNVTCISRDISGKEIRITGTFQVVENIEDLILQFALRYGPYLAIPTLVILMCLCGYRMATKKLGCSQGDANITRSTERNSSFWIFPTESTTTTLELESTRHPQTELACPNVNSLSVSSRPSEPGDYYTEVQEKPSNEKLFNSKDICLVLNIKMGKIYNRWMGTLTLSNGKMQPVLVTTISDSLLKSRALHWDVYIKRILYLPRTMCLVAVEGMYLHKERLYLLHKHLTFDTLETRISREQNDTHLKPCEDILPAWEVMSYMIGILGGFELIQMHGFLHPGLTTKKVLVTKPGQCKIYDFCLSEDAPTKVVLTKTKRCYNHFAPETLERNEYTKASDVWSMGVVFWEIITGGISPFPDNMVSMDRPTPSLQDWPDHYPQLRNKYIFRCWLKFQKKRPTVTSLKNSLLKVCNSDNELHRAYYSRSVINGSSEEASGSAVNLYQSDQDGATMS